jgi:hypothetical protein
LHHAIDRRLEDLQRGAMFGADDVSPSGGATRVRLRIMNRLAGFSAIAPANAARATSSERQIASGLARSSSVEQGSVHSAPACGASYSATPRNRVKMRRQFGASFDAYASKVGRWI